MKRRNKNDPRTEAQIRQHYEIETELADRLRNAPREARRTLYTSLYDEMFRRVPHHSLLTRKTSPEMQREMLDRQLKLLSPFLDESVTFLEVGPGDCSLALEVARLVKRVYAVDVSEVITDSTATPANFQLTISDGSSIPVPQGSIDVVYSNQLIEHLHPDDVIGQLRNIHDALSPGGVYLCVTPNRLSGPHDISTHFDDVAKGFHLREYTVTDLSAMFRDIGFVKVMVYIGGRGRYWRFPLLPVMLVERLLRIMPTGLRRSIASVPLVSGLIGVRLVGVKDRDAGG